MSEISFVTTTNFIQIQMTNHSDSKSYIGVHIYSIIPNTITIQRYIAGLLFECNELNQYVYISNLNDYIQEKSYIITLITNDIVYIENDKLYLANSTLLKLL